MKNSYFTHDNGGRPFKVEVDTENKNIVIYDEDGYFGDDGVYVDQYPCPILKIPSYEKIFIGESHGDFGLGNSILIKIKNNIYIYVGEYIYSFEIDDEIINYESPIGNSDVPYPYAIGDKYVYLMIEQVKINKNDLQTNDPYTHYYYLKKQFNDKDLKFIKFKHEIIVKNIRSTTEGRNLTRQKIKDYEKRKKILNKNKEKK